MKSIFLSHNHADKAFARRLSNDLRSNGVRVWIDEAEIKVGDSLISKIQDGIDNVDYVGVILSQHSVASPWVQEELEMALNQQIAGQRIKVLPLLCGACTIPGFLLGKMYLDMTTNAKYIANFQGLLRRLS